MLLEAAADEEETGRWPLAFEEGELLRCDWRGMIRALVAERDAGTDAAVLAARFLNTLLDLAVEVCRRAAEASGLRDVVLSGGSFQNRYLMERLPGMLCAAGLRPHVHRRVSCNDEGLSLGQLMIAEERRK